ncbi:hypothetical protein [Caproicibacterium sp. XB2]
MTQFRPIFVAPYTGAWIEIFGFPASTSETIVAPYTGAWIEIYAPGYPVP